MRVKSIGFNEFRRFHNLTIQDLPETAKLVILAGPNGNGKSSLFDGMMKFWEKNTAGYSHGDARYYDRMGSSNAVHGFNNLRMDFHQIEPVQQLEKKSFYFRSAYRNEAEMSIQGFERMGPVLDERRFARLIDNDAAVGLNYKRMVSQGLEDVYERENPSNTIGDFREVSIGRVRNALQTVFPHLRLDSLGNPMEIGEFRFTKGNQAGYSYKNLSGGEKAVFDLLLDLFIKSRMYDDTVFCIDEPEAHLNPRVHGALLDAMLSLISPASQLWVSTHAIGMLRRARDVEQENSGSVAVLDFDADFDIPQVLRPVRMNRAFWLKSLEVAVDDLASLIAPSIIIACESSSLDGKPGEGHDAAIYNSIFADEFPEARFVSIGSFTDLKGDRFAVLQAVTAMVKGTKLLRLRDRDGMTQQEITAARAEGMKVLNVRNIEGYLFSDDVLALLCVSVGQTDKIDKLLAGKAKDLAAASAQGHSTDDLKKSAGRIMSSCKKVLGLTNAGSTNAAFMRDTLAPLVVAGTATYAALKNDVFD